MGKNGRRGPVAWRSLASGGGGRFRQDQGGRREGTVPGPGARAHGSLAAGGGAGGAAGGHTGSGARPRAGTWEGRWHQALAWGPPWAAALALAWLAGRVQPAGLPSPLALPLVLATLAMAPRLGWLLVAAAAAGAASRGALYGAAVLVTAAALLRLEQRILARWERAGESLREGGALAGGTPAAGAAPSWRLLDGSAAGIVLLAGALWGWPRSDLGWALDQVVGLAVTAGVLLLALPWARQAVAVALSLLPPLPGSLGRVAAGPPVVRTVHGRRALALLVVLATGGLDGVRLLGIDTALVVRGVAVLVAAHLGGAQAGALAGTAAGLLGLLGGQGALWSLAWLALAGAASGLLQRYGRAAAVAGFLLATAVVGGSLPTAAGVGQLAGGAATALVIYLGIAATGWPGRLAERLEAALPGHWAGGRSGEAGRAGGATGPAGFVPGPGQAGAETGYGPAAPSAGRGRVAATAGAQGGHPGGAGPTLPAAGPAAGGGAAARRSPAGAGLAGGLDGQGLWDVPAPAPGPGPAGRHATAPAAGTAFPPHPGMPAWPSLLADLARLIEPDPRAWDPREQVGELINDVARRHCLRCPMARTCWQDQFTQTYQAFFDILAGHERGTGFRQEAVTPALRARCPRLPAISRSLAEGLDVLRIEMRWQRRLDRHHRLVAQQLRELAALAAQGTGQPPAPRRPGWRYGMRVGVARTPKEGRWISGDGYLCRSFDQGGRMVLVISDGMGSGRRAANESRLALQLLERMLEAGLPATPAVRLLNTALALRDRETYTTVDLAAVDLERGRVEFVKIGAAPSFVRRAREVQMIAHPAPPAGYVEEGDVQAGSGVLEPGDLVVLVSDGVLSAFGDVDAATAWIRGYLAGLEDDDPRRVAARIVKEALRRSGDRAPDDMTVVTGKLLPRAQLAPAAGAGGLR
ncbi:SpoIIE family protein phosphatase [Thermaerobacter sp. PB12/4term]|nr:SpoIIE family protein phosphatase [Thermaerobacter sp. PB12/4term]